MKNTDIIDGKLGEVPRVANCPDTRKSTYDRTVKTMNLKNDGVPGVRLDDAQVLSNGEAHLLTLHTSSSEEVALLDWATCGVVYSNPQSLEAGGYQPIAIPTFRAYDFYESEEWRQFEKFSQWYKDSGAFDDLERAPESHAIKLVWLAYKEREERAVLMLRYFKAARRLEGSRTFWEAQDSGDVARRSWVRDALDYVRMTEAQYKEAGFLADTSSAAPKPKHEQEGLGL